MGRLNYWGGDPFSNPEHKTLLIGLHSNLRLPEDASVEISPTLPEGVDLGLQFHPGLLQSILQRMLYEGEISRRYDGDSEGDSEREGEGEGESLDAEMSDEEQGSEGYSQYFHPVF